MADSFETMGLKSELLRGIYTSGLEKPSTFQQRALMPLLEGERKSRKRLTRAHILKRQGLSSPGTVRNQHWEDHSPLHLPPTEDRPCYRGLPGNNHCPYP
jgi:hypothetical protein